MEKNENICSEKCIHYNKINNSNLNEIKEDELLDLADIFKLFSDSTRIKIICSILNTELCVCDLCEMLNLNQSTVSHQLQLLRNAKLVKYRREGKQVFYSLEDEHIEQIMKIALLHLREIL